MCTIKNLALQFCEGEYDYEVKDDVWPKVFEYLLENEKDLSVNKERVHTLWTVNGGHLRRNVDNDDLVLSVLLNFLPKYDGTGLVLFRGECKFLYDDKKIGFCWTPEVEVAKGFASGLNSIESGGVLLTAYAPSYAIISSPNKHSANQMQEFEYTCNPNFLENIRILETFGKF